MRAAGPGLAVAGIGGMLALPFATAVPLSGQHDTATVFPDTRVAVRLRSRAGGAAAVERLRAPAPASAGMLTCVSGALPPGLRLLDGERRERPIPIPGPFRFRFSQLLRVEADAGGRGGEVVIRCSRSATEYRYTIAVTGPDVASRRVAAPVVPRDTVPVTLQPNRGAVGRWLVALAVLAGGAGFAGGLLFARRRPHPRTPLAVDATVHPGAPESPEAGTAPPARSAFAPAGRLTGGGAPVPPRPLAADRVHDAARESTATWEDGDQALRSVLDDGVEEPVVAAARHPAAADLGEQRRELEEMKGAQSVLLRRVDELQAMLEMLQHRVREDGRSPSARADVDERPATEWLRTPPTRLGEQPARPEPEPAPVETIPGLLETLARAVQPLAGDEVRSRWSERVTGLLNRVTALREGITGARDALGREDPAFVIGDRLIVALDDLHGRALVFRHAIRTSSWPLLVDLPARMNPASEPADRLRVHLKRDLQALSADLLPLEDAFHGMLATPEFRTFATAINATRSGPEPTWLAPWKERLGIVEIAVAPADAMNAALHEDVSGLEGRIVHSVVAPGYRLGEHVILKARVDTL